MGDMTKKDITKLAFKYGYFPAYSGKMKKFFFRAAGYDKTPPTTEQIEHIALFGTIIN